MQYSWINTSSYDREQWRAICPDNEYRIYGQNDFPSGLLPDGLVKKSNSIVVLCSGYPGGEAYYMAYVNRVDEKDFAIDGEPFLVGFMGDDPMESGCFVHHGGWHGRTTRPSPAFFQHLLNSGIGVYYRLPGLPTSTAGSLYDISGWDGREAFSELVHEYKDWSTDFYSKK